MDSLRGDHVRRRHLIVPQTPSRQGIVGVAFAIIGLLCCPNRISFVLNRAGIVAHCSMW